MLAALKGHTSVCRCLLDRKADPNANNEYGETPLMMASAMGHKDVVSLLLDSGADANAQDANEMSAVKKASRWGHVECLRTCMGARFLSTAHLYRNWENPPVNWYRLVNQRAHWWVHVGTSVSKLIFD